MSFEKTFFFFFYFFWGEEKAAARVQTLVPWSSSHGAFWTLLRARRTLAAAATFSPARARLPLFRFCCCDFPRTAHYLLAESAVSGHVSSRRSAGRGRFVFPPYNVLSAAFFFPVRPLTCRRLLLFPLDIGQRGFYDSTFLQYNATRITFFRPSFHAHVFKSRSGDRLNTPGRTCFPILTRSVPKLRF